MYIRCKDVCCFYPSTRIRTTCDYKAGSLYEREAISNQLTRCVSRDVGHGAEYRTYTTVESLFHPTSRRSSSTAVRAVSSGTRSSGSVGRAAYFQKGCRRTTALLPLILARGASRVSERPRARARARSRERERERACSVFFTSKPFFP